MVPYPDLPGCITCGENIESAVVNALDAKKAWLIESTFNCSKIITVY